MPHDLQYAGLRGIACLGLFALVLAFTPARHASAQIFGFTSPVGLVTEDDGTAPSIEFTISLTQDGIPVPSEFVAQDETVGMYGIFSLKSTETTTGTIWSWSYTLDNSNPAVDMLNNGEFLEDIFSVTTVTAAIIRTTEVTVRILGTDELAFPEGGTIMDLQLRVGVPVDIASFGLAATGGVGTILYKISPEVPGVELDEITRRLSGLPRITASPMPVSFTARGRDGSEVSLTFMLTIRAPPAIALSFGGATIMDQNYVAGMEITSLTLPEAIGGSGAFTYSLSEIPDGLIFDADSRVLSGTPASSLDEVTYTYLVTDADSDIATLIFTITVAAAAMPSFGADIIDDQRYTVGRGITPLTLPVAIGGEGMLSYTLSPDPPPGLTFDSEARPPTITGTPMEPRSSTIYTYRAVSRTADTSLTFAIAVVSVDNQPATFPDDANDDGEIVYFESVVEDQEESRTSGSVIRIMDPDGPDQEMFVPRETDGLYGTFSVMTDGIWVYDINNSLPATQALRGAVAVLDSFTVTTADGTTVKVSVTVIGTRDDPTAMIIEPADGVIVRVGSTIRVVGVGMGIEQPPEELTYRWEGVRQTPLAVSKFADESALETFWTAPLIGVTGEVTVELMLGVKGVDNITFLFSPTVAVTVVPLSEEPNTAPVAVNDAITVVEGGTATTLADGTTSVLMNDSDAEPLVIPLMAVLVASPIHGELALNEDGTFTYMHVGSETTSDSFTYRARDEEGAQSNVATVTITVTPQNDPAVVGGDVGGEVAEDDPSRTEATGRLTISDPDDPETVTALDVVGIYGRFTLTEDGAWTYRLDNGDPETNALAAGARETDAFAVEGDDVVIVVVITVFGANDAPVAVDDDVETNEDTALVFDVHTNDVDVDGDILFVAAINGTNVIVGDGQAIAVTGGGTLTLNADGFLSFNPNGEFEDLAPDDIREVTATYQITDGRGGTDEGTVTIMVTGENDAPMAVADAITVAEGGTATTLTGGALSVLDNDSDVDTAAGSLRVTLMATSANGLLTLNEDGTFSYAHNGSETSSDSFTYTVNDGALDSAPATVTITVTPENDAPVAEDDAITVAEGGTATALTDGTTTSVRDNDSDAETETDSLTVRVDTDPTNGALTLNPDGTFSYTHDGSETVSDRFTYIANDGALDSVPATVTIMVTPENDAPVAVDDTVTVAEGGTATTLTDGTTTSVRDNDSDAETATNALTVRVNTGPAHGALDLDEDGTFTYTHNGDEDDSDSFTYIVNDTERDSAPATVTITVTPENDAPVAVDDDVETNEDTVVVFDVHTNDVDVDGDSLFVAAINGTDVMADDGQAIAVTGGGTLTLNADGFLSFNPNGEFEDLVPDESREVTATYQITDGRGGTDEGTVTITVTGENEAPVAVADAITVAEGGTATTLTGGALSVRDNDSDVETPTAELTVRMATAPDNGALTLNLDGTFSYTHDGSETSSDSFTYIANDGADDSAPATVTITVTPVNDAPVAVADEITVAEGGTATTLMDGALNVLANDSDADTATNALTVMVDSVPANGALTLNADGTFSYVHDGSETSSDSFTYIVNDGDLDSAPATVTITVTPENDAPVAVDDAVETNEDTAVVFDVHTNDVDVDGGPLLVAAINGTAVMADDGQAIAVTDGGTLTLNADGFLSFNPNGEFEDLAPDERREVTATYQITDGRGGTDDGTVTITVTGENDAPVAVDDAVETNEDTAVVFDVHTNDVDVDGGPLLVAAINGTAVMADDGQAIAVTGGGTLTLNADGFLSFNPNGEFEDLAPDDIREVTATYQITDGRGGTDDGTVTITVTGENDAPVAVADAVETNEDTAVVFDVHTNDVDVDGDSLSVAAINGTDVMAGGGQAIAVTDGGTLTLNADGRLSFNPNGEFEDLAPDDIREGRPPTKSRMAGAARTMAR